MNDKSNAGAATDRTIDELRALRGRLAEIPPTSDVIYGTTELDRHHLRMALDVLIGRLVDETLSAGRDVKLEEALRVALGESTSMTMPEVRALLSPLRTSGDPAEPRDDADRHCEWADCTLPMGESPCERRDCPHRGGSNEQSVGIITADPITTHEQLEAAYQRAIRGRHISEIEPILALRNAALEALVPTSAAIHANDCPQYRAFFEKHALGSKVAPSCFKCGHVGERSIQHLELPDIYICTGCVSTGGVGTSALADTLEKLAFHATAAPWHYTRPKNPANGIGTLYGPDCLIYTTPVDIETMQFTRDRQAADGELMAALRNALPEILSRLRSAIRDGGSDA